MQPLATPFAAPDHTRDGIDCRNLAALRTRIVDALAGFEKMVETAEPGFRPVAERFRDLHARHAHRMSVMLSDLGHPSDADGSLMGTVNRTVVGLRAAFDRIDADVMDQVRSGEAHVLDAFDTALDERLAPHHLAALHAMRDELARLLDETAALD